VHPISALADDFCYPDACSFSRAVKMEYGYSHSDARAGGLAWFAVEVLHSDQDTHDVAGFGDLLRAP
jgi:hypothetical protein